MTEDNRIWRDRLSALLAELRELEETGREAASTVELDQTRVGRLSRMDAMQAQAMSAEANRRRAEQINRIEGALKRIDEGDYGWCADCGEAIDPRRLEFDPAAELCIRGAGAREERS